MSYTGSRERMAGLVGRVDNTALRSAVAWPLGIMAIAMWWVLITVWYMVFGIFVVPWRLIRRGSRKRKLENQRQRELMQAVERDH